MTRFFPLPLLLLLVTLPLSGCESLASAIVEGMEQPDPNDTAPQTTRTTQLAVTFNGMEVLRDCEGVAEGAGEFDISVNARSSFASSASGEVYKGTPQISEGHRTGGFGRRVFEGPAVDGQTLNITFRASEMDKPVIGAARPDSRLNNVSRTGTHTYSNGRWSLTGPRYITLGGGACQVRLHYELEQLS